ncbi:ABC transporter ATP-binding protein [Zhengella mangrovi]|uniref:ABC transporter ATP-binding protein n=1 Tax=Zhengella mangrovi TaxID=1982044 RepID=A0A2G1QMX1_9HYPH|nr:ABC transporter ATP-binding protein [Zhengella mangrovi]PHP66814.1 ABC transporter ATP-binding protein [Zhengella mangrovi]
MFTVENIQVSYSGIRALRGVSIEVADGETVALIGPNGAGKSSLLNTVSGLVRPTAGSVRFQGRDLTGSAPWTVTQAGILQVPEGRHVFSEMSVLENLLIGETAMHGRTPTHGLDDIFALFPILAERREQLAGSLSGGQQQMLAIARGLMGAPRLLLLDEPSLGLAPVIIAQVFSALAELKKQGLTILLVEQNAHLALSASDRTYVIEQGVLVKSGRSADLQNDPDITASYLGQG